MASLADKLEQLDAHLEKTKTTAEIAIKEGREVEYETATSKNGLEVMTFKCLPHGEIQDVRSLGYG